MTVSRDATGSRTADIAVAWILYALQLAGEALLVMVWLTSVMMIDGCGSATTEAAVCNMAYFATWWFAYAAVLVIAAVATPIAIIVAGRRHTRRWPWPALVMVLLAVTTAGYVFLFTR